MNALNFTIFQRTPMKIIVKFLAVFAGGLLAGALIMQLGFSLWPRATIYDRLSDLQLSFQRSDFDEWGLQHATYLSQYDQLEWLKSAFDEKQSQKGVYDSLHVYLDVGKNVVWVELWLDNEPTNLEWLGFYFYHEVD